MKPVPKTRSGGDSCSCTTCVYKSESDHPSLRQIINLGSRIDRLYYGKYIPLRERKLLDRLVRTRAVYDDIRAQLVSDSTLSLSTKGSKSKGYKNKGSVRVTDDTEKSSGAVLELVNMVDRGAVGTKKLDDCCSCCSCSSKIKLHEHRHRRQRKYDGAQEYLARQQRLRETDQRKKGVRFKTKHIRSDPCTCTFKLIKKHSKTFYKKIHQRYPLPHAEFKPTIDDELGQYRKRIGDIARTSYQNLIESNARVKEKISEEITKLRESQTRIQEKIELQTKLSIEKANQAKHKLASKVKTGAKKIRNINKSEWQIGPENELAYQVKKDSINKFKEELRRKQIMKDWECEPECIEDVCVPEECFIKLKQKKVNRKNLHHKGMNYNIKTRERKAGDPSLRQSTYKIQAQELTMAKTIETNKPVLRAQQSRGIKVSRVILENASKKFKNVGATNIAPKQKEKETNVKLTPTPERISVENINANQSSRKAKLENSSLERESTQRQAVRIGSSFSFNIEFYKDKPGQEIQAIDARSYSDSKQHPGINYRYEKPVKGKKIKKKHLRQQGSQIKFLKSLKNTQTVGGHALKRCFCTLKLKAKANKSKIKRHATKKITTTETSANILKSARVSTLSDVQTNTKGKRKRSKSNLKTNHFLPYECEPGVCIPGQCDPYECIKLINTRKVKRRNSRTQARITKTTSSLTSRSYKSLKAKNIQSKVTHQGKPKPLVEKHAIRGENTISNSRNQAVRIESTFSFNVEFYKGSPSNQQTSKLQPPLKIKSLSIKPKQRTHRKVKLKDRGYQGKLGNVHRNTPTQMVKKERSVSIGTTLKRCFCTLALQKKDNMNNYSTKTLTTGTETAELKPIDAVSKGTKTKLRYNKPLEPYECEPHTCVPGACEPYICVNRINRRKKRLAEVGSKMNRHPTYLESFECEPFTCIPGKCDPYVCLERINKRNKYLKEMGLTTDRSKTTSSSSGNTHPHRSSRTVQYKPKQKEQKVQGRWKAKTQKPKKYAEKNNNAKSRQAVRIGSTFSFDIEFYKNKSPTQQMKKNETTEKKVNANTNKRPTNMGIKMNRLNVAQVKTQVQGPIKRDKSSLVGPLLKRCFCTLNLQKKWKNQYSRKESTSSRRLLFKSPRVYMVNRAMIGYTQGLTNNKDQIHIHNSFNRDELNKTSSSVHHLGNINAYKTNDTRAPIKLKSNFHVKQHMFEMSQQCKETYKVQSQKSVKRLENFVERTDNTVDFSRNSSLSSHMRQTRLSLTRYFRRCFYTMNLKVENRNFKVKHYNEESNKKKKHKLLPYECEPGVCIPGECNPYECQQVIAKRLSKSSSKKSGTGYSSHSISSSANKSKSKEYKQQTLMKKPRKPQIFEERSQVYKRTAINNKKQAVRIGSSFSFDIQFSKNLSKSHKDIVLPKFSSDTNLAKRVKPYSKSKGIDRRRKYFDSQSQSVSIKTIHRGSHTKPYMKRCFCTLKLQKKGRLHKKIDSRKTLISLNASHIERTVSRGQNTKRFKPLKLKHALKPYECEPNICIPGQCDPYQCSEKIKRRNYREEIGTSTLLHETKSVSSMTSDNQRKKMRRSRAVDVKPKKVTYKAKDSKNYSEYSAKPSRNAIRVGSSFSFNMEFYKDHPSYPPPHHIPTYIRTKSKESRHSRESSPSYTKHANNYTQNKSNLRHKQSQFETIARHASTLTSSFIKRCFCTTQLYNSQIINDNLKPTRNKNSQSFVQRCFCVLKKIKPTAHNTVAHVKSKETQEKKINTRRIQEKPKLEDYECEPGICIPGECNPHECKKFLRKRKNEKSKATNANTFKTRSISSDNIEKSKKSVNTFMKPRENMNIKNRRIKNHQFVSTTSISQPKAISWSPDRKAVRIGSKFSFDIEFFKDHPLTINHNEKSVTHKPKLVKDTYNKKKLRTGSTKTFSPSFISQSSQVKKKKVKERGIGINNLIKRCFCTLKLNEKTKDNHKRKIKEINDQIYKNVRTKSVMTVKKNNLHTNALLPYECEPNTCIPYQCDPYECEKRIKLRRKNQLNREFGVSTLNPNKVSTYSITDSEKPRIKNQHIRTKNFQQRVKQSHKNSDIGQVGQSKQSVRIGSTFSFNIEFFKDNLNDGLELHKQPKKDYYHNDRIRHETRRRRRNRNNSIQTYDSHKRYITNRTQFENRAMSAQSTMTATAPDKRCFCTLSLKKSKVKLPEPTKTLHASTETDVVTTAIHPVPYLLPYECEPNACIPGQCNPVQCLDRIKRRQGTLLPFECEPKVCVPGECNPIQCLERIKKRHKTLGTTMIDPRRTTLGTSMNESEKKHVATIMKRRKDTNKKKAKQLQLNSANIHDSNNNRQAVRIGSNFSFNIEFFKTNNTNYMESSELPKLHKTKHKLNHKSASSNLENKKYRSQAFQSYSPKKVSHGSSMGPFLKRCFCTLKLQKAHLNKNPITVDKQLTKPKQRKISNENKSTATRKLPTETYNLSSFECEPFTCVPGECDPHECAKRIQMREKKRKCRYTITQSHTQSQKGVGIKQDNMKSQRSQANFIDKNTFVPQPYLNRPEIVEVPRFPNIFNKQAVRFGSNISFNIEFYKENVPITTYEENIENDKILYRKKPKIIHHRKQNTNMAPLRSRKSEYNNIKTDNKSVNSENILKRCFCTLKLQNNESFKNKKKNMKSTTQFPQNFEVRRVAVQHNLKMASKEKCIGAKSVATKMNTKYLKRSAPCKLCFCQNVKTLFPEEMKTILPYMPEKFNKTVSRTLLLPLENKCNKPKQSILKNRGKRLTHKISDKYLLKQRPIIQEKNTQKIRFRGIKRVISWCVRIFHTKSYSQNHSINENMRNKTLLDKINSSKSERQARSNQLLSNLQPNKLNQACPYYLVYQSGDTEQWPAGIPTKLNKKQTVKQNSLNKKSNTKQQIISKKNQVEDKCTCKLIDKKQNTKSLNLNSRRNQIVSRKNSMDSLCTFTEVIGSQTKKYKNKKELKSKKNKVRSSPLKVHFLDTLSTNKFQSDKADVKKKSTMPINKFKSDKSNVNHLSNSKNKQHSNNKEEFHKAAGDTKEDFLRSAKDQLLKIKIPPIYKLPAEKFMSKMKDKMRCALNSEEPILEMQVDAGNYQILNRNEVIHNIPNLKTKCRPVIELQVDPNMHKILNKRSFKDNVIRSKSESNQDRIIRSIMEMAKSQNKSCLCPSCTCALRATSKPTGKPCICGSPLCADKIDKLKIRTIRHKWKPCLCGSPVCNSESAKINTLTAAVEHKCYCGMEMAKRKKKLEAEKLKKEKMEREHRLKLYEKKDAIRKRERKAINKKLERKIDKKASDGVLLAENVLDVGKLGITATTDLLRNVARTARDPKHAFLTLRTIQENPMLLAKFLQSTYHETGFSSTLRRIRLRCLAMRGVKKIRSKLESYPLTNYLLNINNTDPRRRLLKKKKLPPKRERERLDFHCSLYMASLRKRPYLSVYDRCPWFYQHFLSLVYAWKQFVDVCLFILAAVVWSPCILCMEICRACMCCFFCTG